MRDFIIEATRGAPPFAGLQDRQRALLHYVDEFVTLESVSDPIFATLRQFYDAAGVVEITLTAGFYVMGAMVTRALRIERDPVRPTNYGIRRQ